ncbi:hypothetical protein Tco_1127324 [Tanacetum coccineum]
MSYDEIRLIFEKVWDFNQHIEPMEHKTKKTTSPKKSPEKMKSAEKMEEEDLATQKEMKEVSKKLEQRERNLFLEKAQGRDKIWRKMRRRKNSKAF